MLRLLLAMVMVFVLLVPIGFANGADLVDSTPDYSRLIDLGDWYAAQPAPTKPGITGETVFSSPREAIMLRTAAKGTSVNSHYHNVADEVVYVVSGCGEILVNGEWKVVKAGDLHVNPRGVVHATRVLGNEDLRFISFFAPPQPAGGDVTFIKNTTDVAPAGLVNSKPGEALLVGIPEWYATHPAADKPGIIGETIYTSPRALIMIRDAGQGTVVKSHYHATADEIVLVVAGRGEILINGQWNEVEAGDLHINPRGVVHATRTLNKENLRFISIFTPPQPAGGDVKWAE